MPDKADDIQRLVERIEGATGPDRAIDGAIAAALEINPTWARKRHDRQPELFSDDGPGLRARTWLAPKFTASIDAAMALATEGSRIILNIAEDGITTAIVAGTQGCAATPALALCAAALRARMTLDA